TRVAMHEATRIIREQQPTKLTTVDKTLKGDIETIALKAVEKDRERRYQSATDFAQDIRRYLSNEAIIARPPSVLYQFRILVRRNKPVFAALAVVFVVLVCATIVSTTQYFKAERSRREAVAARDVARQQRDRAITAEERALTEAAKSEQIATFMRDMLKGVGPSKALGRDTTMLREILDQTAQRVGAELANQPDVEASIGTTIGQTYLDLGAFDEADKHLQVAEAIATRELGGEDRRTLLIRSALADVRGHQGRFPAAEALVRRTLEVQRRVLGEEHSDTLASLTRLADLQSRQAYYTQAEKHYHQALEAQRELLGNDHPDTLRTMHGLATTLRAQGKYPEAETLGRQTLSIRRRSLGDVHPDTLKSIHNLAVVLRYQGKQTEAEQLYRESLDAERRVLGADHPATLKSMNNLAVALEGQGKYSEAEEVYRETVDFKRRVFGEEHLSTRTSMGGLAAVLRRQGKLEDARFFYIQVLAQLRRAANRPNADSNALNSYAWFLLTCESTDLRDPQAALAAARKAVETSNLPSAQLFDTLALAYKMTGDMSKVVETQREAVALLPPGESSLRAQYEARLGQYLTEMGSFAEAEPLLLDTYSQIRDRPGARPEQVREALERLVNLYEAWGKADKAAKYHAALSEREAAKPAEPEAKLLP
ncbi:MAG: tetratricopeptide repeat protein, partial [Phycisphaerales bacterium]